MSRTYVVTGAGSGIGKTTAELLRAQGQTVIGVDLRGSDIDGDLASPAGRRAAAAAAIERSGGSIDAVIACAGISIPTALTAAVNYYGMTEFLTELRPVLAQSATPRAALVASLATIYPHDPALSAALTDADEDTALAIARELEKDPVTGNMIYASSKRAVSVWTRRQSVTPEWAGAGIPLNAVAPGTVTTPMTEAIRNDPAGLAMIDAIVPMPLNYHQPASSIAKLLIWLTSEDNSHCTGQTMFCDGGAEVVLRGDDVWAWSDPAVGAYFASLSGGAPE